MADEEPAWWKLLLVVRKISGHRSGEGKVFTAADFAGAADLGASKKASAHQMASGWLSKFCKWGYVVRAGSAPGEKKKWIRLYQITKYGRECELMPGLDALLQAVLQVEEVRGGSGEEEAWEALMKVVRKIKPEA